MLNKKDYVKFSPDGAVDAIFCKVCGDPIASTEAVPIDNHGHFAFRFRRKPNYREIKILFEDGHFHVTNGCKKCLSMNLSPEVLDELVDADDAQMPDISIKESKAVRVVSMDDSGAGIL